MSRETETETDNEIIDQLDKVFYNGEILKKGKRYVGVIIRKAMDGIAGSFHVSSLCESTSAFITQETVLSILAGKRVTITIG